MTYRKIHSIPRHTRPANEKIFQTFETDTDVWTIYAAKPPNSKVRNRPAIGNAQRPEDTVRKFLMIFLRHSIMKRRFLTDFK